MSAFHYEIPEGCICLGDGLYGMHCDAKEHVRYFCRCGCGCTKELKSYEVSWAQKNPRDPRAYYCGKCYQEMA